MGGDWGGQPQTEDDRRGGGPVGPVGPVRAAAVAAELAGAFAARLAWWEGR
ncbi:MAG TPA: hypothetical protein VD866_32085 [Urbifossiella sp.]|nr:hypothetical protein [Urbifossiella sp.]